MKNLIKMFLLVCLITINSNATNLLLLAYPATNLKIKNIILTKGCRVGVVIENRYKKSFFYNNPKVWSLIRNKTALALYKNGNLLTQIEFYKIKNIDKLKRKDAKIFVKTNIKINKKTRITAKILAKIIGGYKEIKPNNNLTKILICKHYKKPDLIIKRIYTNKSCKVFVEVQNIGNGWLPNSVNYYKKPNSASIYLYRNGKRWGGRTLWSFKNVRYHLRPNGILIYRSNLRVKNGTRVTATVDMTHKINESNEFNNNLTKIVNCNR